MPQAGCESVRTLLFLTGWRAATCERGFTGDDIGGEATAGLELRDRAVAHRHGGWLRPRVVPDRLGMGGGHGRALACPVFSAGAIGFAIVSSINWLEQASLLH